MNELNEAKLIELARDVREKEATFQVTLTLCMRIEKELEEARVANALAVRALRKAQEAMQDCCREGLLP